MSNPFAHTIAAITAEHLAREQVKQRTLDEALAAFAEFDEVIAPAKVRHRYNTTDLDGCLYLDDNSTTYICYTKWRPDEGWVYTLPGTNEHHKCPTMRQCLSEIIADPTFGVTLFRAQEIMRTASKAREADAQQEAARRKHIVRYALVCAVLVVAVVLSIVYGAEIPL